MFGHHQAHGWSVYQKHIYSKQLTLHYSCGHKHLKIIVMQNTPAEEIRTLTSKLRAPGQVVGQTGRCCAHQSGIGEAGPSQHEPTAAADP